MFEFMINNISTILVGFAVLVLIGFVALKMIRDKKNGKSSCAGGCANCPGAGICHTK